MERIRFPHYLGGQVASEADVTQETITIGYSELQIPPHLAEQFAISLTANAIKHAKRRAKKWTPEIAAKDDSNLYKEYIAGNLEFKEISEQCIEITNLIGSPFRN